jgi:outer membrane protein TolC
MNRINLFTLSSYLLFSFFLVQPDDSKAQQLTLQEAFERALMNNHAIEMERIEEEKSENLAIPGNAGLLPSLDLVGGGEFSVQDADLEIADFNEDGGRDVRQISVEGAESRTYNASVQLSYTLFDGFRNRYRYQQLKSQNSAARLSTRITIENTLLEVADAYLALLRAEENITIREENLAISRDRLERIREDRRVGSATELNVLNAEVNFNADEIELSAAQVDRRNAVRTLLFLMGEESNGDIEPVDSFGINTSLNPDELLRESLTGNAALLLSEERMNIAELNKNIVGADRFPRVSLSGSYGYFRQEIDASNLPLRETTGFTGGLTLRYNLFSGLSRKRAVDNARLDIKSSREQKMSVEKEVRTEVLNSYERYANTLRQLELTRLNVQTAERNFENSREAFRLGQISSIELREAQVNLLNENLRLNNLTYLAKQNELLLMVLSGQLLGEM